MNDDEKYIAEFVKDVPFDAPDDKHREALKKQLLSAYPKHRLVSTARAVGIWRTIMRSRITRPAVAATIIVAAIIGMHFVGNPLAPTVTWAQVIQPILDAKTAVLSIIIGEEGQGPVIHDEIMGSRIRRTMSNMDDVVSIIDLEAGRILSLTISKKEAAYIDLKGLPSMPNYMDTLRNLISELQESPHFVVEELGRQEIDGQEVIGFLAKHPKVDLTIWADAETALPVRIEQIQGQMKIICKDMEFNVSLDESQFSMEAPAGYKVQQVDLDLLGATEQEFIEGLRIRAELFGDGRFPDGVAVEDYLKEAPAITKKFEELGLSDEEETELGMQMSRHLLFIRFFQGEGKWHYAGAGVRLGDAETAIFWYRPKDSETYRVIYGDLSVRDAAPQDLPEPLPATKDIRKGIGYQQWSKSEFVGTQADQWRIMASGKIEVHSYINLRKGPENLGSMPIALPYSSGVLQSVTLDDQTVAYSRVGEGRYKLELPLEQLAGGQTILECVWTLSLDELEKTGYGRQVTLGSLVPVVCYKLVVVLEPDCGFAFSGKHSSKRTMVPFSWNADPTPTVEFDSQAGMGGPSPKTKFGSCGIPVWKLD